jgi:hypothetical protein
MSLGNKTKCDLSAGIAKLDIDKVKEQIEIHYYSLLEKMEKKMSNIRNNSLTSENRREEISSMSATGANDVLRLAEQIATTTELLHTLNNKKDRTIKIV